MITTYHVDEMTPDSYEGVKRVREAPGESSVNTYYGPFATGAEVLAAMGQPIGNVIYGFRQSQQSSSAYDPPFPVGYAILSPTPEGVALATVAEPDLIRVCRGDFRGLKLTFMVTPDVDYTTTETDASAGYVYTTHTAASGVSTVNATLTRDTKFLGGLRNGQHGPPLLMSGVNIDSLRPYGSGGINYYRPFYGLAGQFYDLRINQPATSPRFTEVAALGASSTVLAVSSSTDPDAPGETSTTTENYAADDPPGSAFGERLGTSQMAMGFCRRTPGSRPVGLMFLASCLGAGGPYSDNGLPRTGLYVYAPLASGSSLAFYNIPEVPIITRPDGTTISATSVDEDGPVILGVQTRVFGWHWPTEHNTDETDYSDLGTEDYLPTVMIEELA